jgi:endonuclease/exonuclease/phosphatase family metal-dependent hydrolase
MNRPAIDVAARDVRPWTDRRRSPAGGSALALRTALTAVTIAVVVTSVMATGPAAAETSHRDRELTVMTFNIHHGVGVDGRLDLDRIAEVIRSSGADVVALQEVDRHFSERSAFADQAQELGRALHMHVAYGANLDLEPLAPGQPRRQYGNAVLSRHRIRSSRNILLPRLEGEEQRGLLEVSLRVRGVPVRVYATHLQHNSAVSRQLQAEAILQAITSSDSSMLLLGDLNAQPEDPEIVLLLQLLVDAWMQAGLGPGYTYSAANPHSRIDYVLHSGEVVSRVAAVLATDVSDHLPVVVTMVLPGNRMDRDDL